MGPRVYQQDVTAAPKAKPPGRDVLGGFVLALPNDDICAARDRQAARKPGTGYTPVEDLQRRMAKPQ